MLGLAEAGLYPGIVFYLSWYVLSIQKTSPVLSSRSWYKRSELGTRVAAFFTSATVAGAFSE